jgi:hypothetical protein
MMCEIMGLEGFGHIVVSTIILLIVGLTITLKFGMPKNRKKLQALIFNNNSIFEKSRFRVF